MPSFVLLNQNTTSIYPKEFQALENFLQSMWEKNHTHQLKHIVYGIFVFLRENAMLLSTLYTIATTIPMLQVQNS